MSETESTPLPEITPEVAEISKDYSSNQAVVTGIANTGHIITAGAVGYGLGTAIAAGTTLSFLAPLGAAMAGGYLGTMAGNALMDTIFSDHDLAKASNIPACKEHHIAHNHAFLGALGALLAGVVAGALIVVTGGAALVAIAACAGAGLIGGASVAVGSRYASETGIISSGSLNVFFENKPVARVTDTVECEDHPGEPKPRIAQGSTTVFINDLPLARKGDKITCSAVIQEGCQTIFADDSSYDYLPVDADMSVVEQFVISSGEVVTAIFGGKLLNKLGIRAPQCKGDPVDTGTGEYTEERTDFHWPHILPLTLKRAYTGRHAVSGLLGSRWLCNWSQYLEFDSDGQTATYFDAGGLCPAYSTAQGTYNCRNLLVPHYRLTGNRERAIIFDEHTQQGYIFTPVSPEHAACACPPLKIVTATKSVSSITAWAI